MRQPLSVTIAAGAALAALTAVPAWGARSPQTTTQRVSAGPHEGTVQLPGVRLWYVDTGGNGVPVVFLHAATGSVRNWEYQVAAFTKAGYRFLAFDRRGWGRSAIDSTGPQPGTAADDLIGLLDQLGIDQFHLVGTAAGGFVALDCALAFPDRLRSVVVANSIGGIQDAEYLELGQRLRPASFSALPPDFRELGPSYRAANAEGTKRWLEMESVSRPDGPRSAPQPMKKQLTFALLATIRKPVLFMTGGSDLYAPPPVMRLFADRVKGAEFLVVPEAGHSTYWEQPEAFNRAVLDFIGRH